jgi:hypothetical protein
MVLDCQYAYGAWKGLDSHFIGMQNWVDFSVYFKNHCWAGCIIYSSLLKGIVNHIALPFARQIYSRSVYRFTPIQIDARAAPRIRAITFDQHRYRIAHFLLVARI